MLEAAYEALLDAGITPESIRGSNTGVYHGSCFQEPHIGILEPLSIVKGFASCVSRLSYHFDLKGPVYHIDTACASSFCSFHEAVMAVKYDYCDMVIATGSNTCFQPFVSAQMSDLNMISDGGKSKSMDASADGYARSEAVVVVIIQKRKDAKRIYGTVLNSKSNCDGYKVEGITFPGTQAQVQLVRDTYKEINLDPIDIKYIEAHATGTAAGDPIELNSMHEVLCNGQKDRSDDPVLVGCVKTNLGHGEGASGLVSLAKAMIVLQTGLIPPNLHFKTPNPKIKGLMDGQFKPVTEITPLPGDYITLNSFGFGGSNIHTVVTPEKRAVTQNNKICDQNVPRLVLACGRNQEAVEYAFDYIQSHPKTHTRDFMYLMDQMSQVSFETGMHYRSFMIMSQDANDSDLIFEKSQPVKVTHSKPVTFYFTGVQNMTFDQKRSQRVLIKQLMSIKTFETSVNNSLTLLKILNIHLSQDFIPIRRKVSKDMPNYINEDDDILNPKTDINGNFIKNDHISDENLAHSMLHTVMQLALTDVLKKDLQVTPNNLVGFSVGELAPAYYHGCISQHQAILIAYTAMSMPHKSPLQKMIQNIICQSNNDKKQQFKWSSYMMSHTENGKIIMKPSEYLAERLLNPSNGLENTKNSLIIEISSKGLSLKNGLPESGIKSFLSTIGSLYTNGHKPQIYNIYPQVQLPLPSTTPSLSPLIKWDHRATYKLSKTHLLDTKNHGSYTMMCKNIPFHFDPRLPEDYFLLDHKIDGKSLFPATGYLMIAYSTLCKLLNKPIDEVPVQFSEIKFQRMTIMSSQKEIDFLVRMNEDTGHFEIKEKDMVVVTGTIKRLDHDGITDLHPDMKCFEPERDPTQLFMTTRDIYKEYRVRGYDYQPYFNGIHSALSDGVEATVIWRDIMPWTVRDNFPMPKREDYDNHWLRSWMVFVDCVTQINLLSNKKSGRGLFIPTGLKSLICYPKLLKESIAENCGHPDHTVMSKSSHIKCYTDIKTDSMYTKGLMIKGLKTSLLRRFYDVTRTTVQEFVPHDQSVCMNQEDVKLVSKYYHSCLDVTKKINHGSQVSTNHGFDLKEEKYSLLKYLTDRLNYHNEHDLSQDALEKDLIMGSYESEFYYPDHFVKPVFDMITRCFWTKPEVPETIEVGELMTSKDFNLASIFNRLSQESIYCDKISLSYNTLDINSFKKPFDLTVLKSTSLSSDTNYCLMFKKLFEATKDNGYMIAFHKESCNFSSINKVLNGHRAMEPNQLSLDQLIQHASAAGFSLVLKKRLLAQILPLHLILFRKMSTKLHPDNQIVIQVSMIDFSWMQELKDAMETAKDDQRIWLIPDTKDQLSHNKVTGLIGFVKSLRCEPEADKVRCLIDWRLRDKPEFHDPEYSHILQSDLITNVYDEELEAWGNYEQFITNNIESNNQPSEVYLKPLKPGDLTSLVWAESDIKKIYTRLSDQLPSLSSKYQGTETSRDAPKSRIVKVNYSPLNFKDVLYATGKLPIDSVSGISPVIAQDSLLGLEFAGVDSDGRRIMGSLPYKTLASAVVLDDDSFIYAVPDEWTLEDAATVPVCYMTAIYALDICGHLERHESVLIHAGSGGVGLAAINIALSKDCTIYTTCGSAEKRKFLLQEFPSLNPNHIFNSRDTKFEEDILKLTDGRGVDVILNSLAGDKMKSSLNCLAANGRFLEIGKVDFLNDSKLNAESYDGNKTIIGVFLDSFFNYPSSQTEDKFVYLRQIRERKLLEQLVDEGIKSGIIKPLKRTVFKMDQAEDAFRFMASGKHIGKVMIQIDQEESSSAVLRMDRIKNPNNQIILNQTYFDPTKSYIIIGGLGGFGLEVVQWMAERGAKKFLLSSRRGIREPYQRYCLNRIKNDHGAEVITTQEPISNYDEVKSLVTTCIAKLGPVGGYFNIAALYSDSLFKDQTEEMFENALVPKAQVSYFMDQVTREICPTLDYFVCFSSLSSGRGNPGQGYYNYGNSIMESICYNRVSQGLHGLAIQWGVIGDVGEVSEKAGGNGMVLLGCTSQRIPSCLYHLDMFLQSVNTPVVGSCVLANDSNSDVKETQDVLKLLSRVLGMKNIQAVEPTATLAALGIDSLMAVEIQQIIERNKGVQLPLKTIREMSIKEFIETAS